MKVEDPSGQVWRVSRRWVPSRRRGLDNVGYTDPSAIGLALPDDPVGLLLALAIVAILLSPILVVASVLALEFLALLLLIPFAVLARVAFGRQWHVELRRGWSPWTEQPAGDWQASGVRIHEIADAARRGVIPPRTLGATQRSTGVDPAALS